MEERKRKSTQQTKSAAATILIKEAKYTCYVHPRLSEDVTINTANTSRGLPSNWTEQLAELNELAKACRACEEFT